VSHTDHYSGWVEEYANLVINHQKKRIN